MNPLDIALRGFAMPIYALIDGVVSYTISDVIAAFQTSFHAIQNSSGNASTGLPTWGIFTLCFVIMGLMMTLSGYFEDLSGYAETALYGLGYPVQALIYAVGAIFGLALFWNAISGVTIGGIGSDALFSSVASIIILIVTAAYSLLT